MNKENFIEDIKEILAKVINSNEYNGIISFDTNLVDGIGTNSIPLSSIDYVKFLTYIEEKYDIIYDFETVIRTIGDIHNYIYITKEKEGN